MSLADYSSAQLLAEVSAAQGKPIIDFIEAVADASTGEFERLKAWACGKTKPPRPPPT